MSLHSHQDFIKDNAGYAASFDKADLPLPPAKNLIVVACMDARINVEKQLNLKEGDAHIIRNAGGVVKDALRDIIISQRLLRGTREIAVFHHTGCGMLMFDTPKLRDIVKKSGPDTDAVDAIDFHEFSDVEGSVRSDVEWLKKNPLVLPETTITGWVYKVETGKVRQVV